MTEAELWLLAEQVMTAGQYRTFWLHHHEGFTQSQVATAEGVARSTVQSRLKSGTDRLRDAYKAAIEEAA